MAKIIFMSFDTCVMHINNTLANRIINLSKINLNGGNIRRINISAPVQDVFEPSKCGLTAITNVRQGRFGSVCDGSKPLKSFMDLFPDKDFFRKKILKRGLSTPTNAEAPSFLKSKAYNPLSTSEAHDCSVAYFYNEKDNSHFLFHIHPNMDGQMIKRYIMDYMPEGFQKACIIPGRNYWTVTHKETLPIIFDAIKSVNPKSNVEVFHYSSEMPEVVGYKGNVYEILNENYYKFIRKEEGQATFQVTIQKLINIINHDKK